MHRDAPPIRLCCAIFILLRCTVIILLRCTIFILLCRERTGPARLEVRPPHPVADKLISLFLRQVDLASASESLCRGLGSWWVTARFHRKSCLKEFQAGR